MRGGHIQITVFQVRAMLLLGPLVVTVIGEDVERPGMCYAIKCSYEIGHLNSKDK